MIAVVCARRTLGHNPGAVAIGASIQEIRARAAELIGAEPNRMLLAIDGTGYNTVVRAMVGRETAEERTA